MPKIDWSKPILENVVRTIGTSKLYCSKKVVFEEPDLKTKECILNRIRYAQSELDEFDEALSDEIRQEKKLERTIFHQQQAE